MTDRRFDTTRWSLVLAAGQGGSGTSREALARLCESYWYPVFAFVMRQGHGADEARDLTQGFFARLIERNDIADADPSRGRFRSFLLSACQHFLCDERDRDLAKKRGGGRPPISIDAAEAELRYRRALSHEETPERLYQRQWSLTLLAGVFDGMREQYAADGRERIFDRLKGFLTADAAAGTHAEAARDLGMSVAAVKVAVHRLRRRYGDSLRRHVADTVASDLHVDDEIRHLIEALGSPRDAL